MSVESLRSLEQVRQRLNTLANTIGKLLHDLDSNDPLPLVVCDETILVPIQLLTNAQALEHRPSLQNSANLLYHNLDSLHKVLAGARPLLANAHVYPLPSYPGRTQEDLLTQLLRKKLQPQVEYWVANGQRHAANNAIDPNHTNGSSANPTASEPQPMSTTQLTDLWEWAGREGNRIGLDMGQDAFDDVFTLEEHELGIENVVTGLRRKLWDSDDEDEDEEGEVQGKAKDDKQLDMDVDMVDTIPEPVKTLQRHNVDPSKPPMTIEHILRLALTAREPPNAV